MNTTCDLPTNTATVAIDDVQVSEWPSATTMAANDERLVLAQPEGEVVTRHDEDAVPSVDVEPPAASPIIIAALSPADESFLAERCDVVTRGLSATISVAKALSEIFHYKDGALWRATHISFEKFCRDRFGIGKSHAYRLRDAGDFVVNFEAISPRGDSLPTAEKQVRPLLQLPPERRIEVWLELTRGTSASDVPASLVARRVKAELARSSAVEDLVSHATATDNSPVTAARIRRAIQTAAVLRRQVVELGLQEGWLAAIDGIGSALRAHITEDARAA